MWFYLVGCTGLVCGVLLGTQLLTTLQTNNSPLASGTDTINSAPIGRIISSDPVSRTITIQPLLDNNDIGQITPVPERFMYDDGTQWKERILSGTDGVAESMTVNSIQGPRDLPPGTLVVIRSDGSYAPLKAAAISIFTNTTL